jgi:uncharacterized membrane protein
VNLFGRRVGRRNERGAILVMSVAGVVLAIISAALAIDLGFLAHEARVDQKVADLAVISAIRVLPANPTVAAQQSATRNSFPFASPGYGLLVQWGPSKTGPWSSATTDLAAATAVRVTATSPHTNNFPFVPGGQSTSRSAIGTLGSKAQFSVGSKLADLNSGDNTVLNRVSSAILGTSSPVNLTVVGYQGLASGTVSLADLVAADPSLGTPDSLLTSNITVKKLALATLTALNNKAAGGDTVAAAAATPLATFANNINTNLMVKLGDILDIEQPADPASIAAKTQFSVFDLITGAGEAGMFTGTNAVSIPNLTLGIAGLATETMKLTIIEPPKISAFGPARFDASTGTWATTAHTAQVKLELNSHITVGTCIVLCVDLQMPLTVSAAKATGSLTQITCAAGSSTQQASINVVTTGANGTADNVLTVKVATLPLSLPPIISTNVGLAGGTTSPDLSFSGPPYPTAVQSTAATGAGLTTATTSQFTVLGANLGSVLGLLNPVTTAIDSQILAPTFNALGLSVGGADIKVMRIDCAVPSIAG